MEWFENITKKLFSKSTANNNIPFLEENIVNRGDFMLQYKDWTLSEKHTINIASLQVNETLNGLSNIGVVLLKSPGINGIFFNDSFLNGSAKNEYKFWIECLKNALLKSGYYQYQAKRKIYDRDNYVESIERTYLKPWPSIGASLPIDQMWGNITFELVLINDEPETLKISATYYSDRNYQKERDFYELLGLCFNFPAQ